MRTGVVSRRIKAGPFKQLQFSKCGPKLVSTEVRDISKLSKGCSDVQSRLSLFRGVTCVDSAPWHRCFDNAISS